MFENLLAWAQWFIENYGFIGVFVIAFFESFIFPIPTAAIILPATALGLDPLLVTVVATIGSVLGALVGYYLGYYLGHPAAEKVIKNKKHIEGVERWFDKYGAWAVLIAAFTPIPFKVFTWFGGIFRMGVKKFILASVIGRFFQFAIFAYLGSLLSPTILALIGV